jgi:hypothetical protein
MSKKIKGSQEFYDSEVTRRREAIKDLANDLSFYMVSGSYKDRALLTNTINHINIVKKLGDFNKKSPHENEATDKQTNAATTAKKHCYHYAEFARQIVELSTVDEDLRNFLDLYDIETPFKVKYYLIQAKKCYFFECWDACIVMIARAIEFSLKEYFNKEKIQIKGNPVLGNLLKYYEQYGKKQDIMKYILEVQKMDRNICAHDSEKERQQMSQDEADHSWTAIRIILKELLGVNIQKISR